MKPINPDKIPAIFDQRGLSDETVRTFAPFIRLIRDKKNENFDGYNIGFPYTNGENDKVRGYEIRGYGGYKSKAAGSDSSFCLGGRLFRWLSQYSQACHFSANPPLMPCLSISSTGSSWEMNIVLVSLGGTFSDAQITSVMNRYPEARPFDCFDNDQAGRVYGLRMLSLLEISR